MVTFLWFISDKQSSNYYYYYYYCVIWFLELFLIISYWIFFKYINDHFNKEVIYNKNNITTFCWNYKSKSIYEFLKRIFTKWRKNVGNSEKNLNSKTTWGNAIIIIVKYSAIIRYIVYVTFFKVWPLDDRIEKWYNF